MNLDQQRKKEMKDYLRSIILLSSITYFIFIPPALGQETWTIYYSVPDANCKQVPLFDEFSVEVNNGEVIGINDFDGLPDINYYLKENGIWNTSANNVDFSVSAEGLEHEFLFSGSTNYNVHNSLTEISGECVWTGSWEITGPTPPVPELSTFALTSAGVLGLFIFLRITRKNE